MPEETEAAIAAYLAGTEALKRAVADMSLTHLQARPISGRWSTQEVVCHLNDSEQAWCHRLKRVIAEDRPLLIGYDESRFAARLAYDLRAVPAEIDLFAATRAQMAAILRALPAEAWDRQGVHSERGLISLREMVAIETEHVAHHLRHVAVKRNALGLPDVT